MNKEGQISVFVIVGLVVIAIVGLLLLISSRTDFLTFSGETRAEDVQDFMESCIRDLTSASVGVEGFTGNSDQAAIFLQDYIGKGIRSSCELLLDRNFNGIEKPGEIFVEVDITEIDYKTVGSTQSDLFINPVTGQQQNLYIYERAIVRVNYNAIVTVGEDKVTLSPILVEYEF